MLTVQHAQASERATDALPNTSLPGGYYVERQLHVIINPYILPLFQLFVKRTVVSNRYLFRVFTAQ